MNFLVDAQLPQGLSRWIGEAGHTARHVSDVLLEDADDNDIWSYAIEHNYIIVTKDEDFAERLSRTATGPTVIWLRIGNATNRVLLRWIDIRWTTVVALLDDGHKLIEVR